MLFVFKWAEKWTLHFQCFVFEIMIVKHSNLLFYCCSCQTWNFIGRWSLIGSCPCRCCSCLRRFLRSFDDVNIIARPRSKSGKKEKKRKLNPDWIIGWCWWKNLNRSTKLPLTCDVLPVGNYIKWLWLGVGYWLDQTEAIFE